MTAERADDRARRAQVFVRVYVGFLALVVAGIVAAALARDGDITSDLGWVWLSLVFVFSEYAMLLFHHERGRQGLSAAEAVLLPMVVALSFQEAVLGVTLATLLVNVARRAAPMKAIFNVAEYGCAAAAAAGLWALYRTPSGFTPANALLAVFAVLVFAFLTHVLVTIAISLAEHRTLAQLSRDIAPAIGFNLAGNITLGVLFAAAYTSARWTVALFPFAIGALYLGYRAVMKQTLESERVAHLHAASRALAATPNLNEALVDFLHAVAEIASASEAHVVMLVQKDLKWSGVRHGETVADLHDATAGPLAELVSHFQGRRAAVVADSSDAPAAGWLLELLDAHSAVAVPLLEGESVAGALVAVDRVGADSFGVSDAQVLEALASELSLTLDSYRLFGEISDERERFLRIFTGSKEGICLLDDGGVVRAWNPALERITGFAATGMVGKRWWDKLVVRNAEQRRLEGNDLLAVDPEAVLEVLTREGPARWISVAADEVGPRDEKGWVLLVRDVTAQHEAEEAKSDFLATISHELRTPLTTIKGSLQVLERGASELEPETVDQMVDMLGRGADRLERLVMNLLFVSQIESGRVTVVGDQIDLNALVTKRLSRWASLRVDWRGNAEELVVRADKEKLRQTIDHLLDNAFKYGGEHSLVTVTTSLVNGYGRLSVRDEGPGIPAADQQRIFERFVRLGDTLTREAQGAGVGLFIARRSVEAMDGRIWVESHRGRGAEFVVELPLARPTAVADDASA
jgi:PAS domain S-box-containing protein